MDCTSQKLIVEEQGGKIRYDSTVGEGSIFYFLTGKSSEQASPAFVTAAPGGSP